jgi:hypothetical protein
MAVDEVRLRRKRPKALHELPSRALRENAQQTQS